MIRTGTLIGLISLVLIALEPSSAQEQAPSSTTPSDSPPIKKLGKMDVRHPLRIGSAYYPKESMKHHEQGKCRLAFFIEADGTVPATQLLQSSGFPRLDTACFESVIGVPLIPTTINGTPVAGWSDFNLVWVIDHGQPYQPPPDVSAFPRMSDDYEFQVGEKFYPGKARAKQARGYCVVHTAVGSTGATLNAAITRSTGSAILDKACIAAVSAARFTPELQNGTPVADSTDIAIYW
jgi:TonB family protein